MVQMMDTPALKKVWLLDVQWTDCPPEVEKVVQSIWRWREFGNDNYMFRTTLKELRSFMTDAYDIKADVWYWGETPEEQKGWVEEPLDFSPLVSYLDEKIGEDDTLIIHWWW